MNQLKSLEVIRNCFVDVQTTKQILTATKPFSACRAEPRKPGMIIKAPTNRRTAPKLCPETVKMRPLSFILAFAFVMAGPSLVGSSDSGLPGTGTFSYNGSPIVTSAPMVVAAN